MSTEQRPSPIRQTLLVAAITLMKRQGYNGTSVDDICREAGVTKGSFFHYFSSKEELAKAALAHSAVQLDALAVQAGYRARLDPKERVLGFVEFKRQQLQGDLSEVNSLAGAVVQDVYVRHPALRDACASDMAAQAQALEADLKAAKALYAPKADWDVKSLAMHVQAVWQGAFVAAKATGNTDVAIESMRHLYRYLNQLLPRPQV